MHDDLKLLVKIIGQDKDPELGFRCQCFTNVISSLSDVFTDRSGPEINKCCCVSF